MGTATSLTRACIGVAVLGLTVAAGCGGGSSTAPTTTTTTPTAQTTNGAVAGPNTAALLTLADLNGISGLNAAGRTLAITTAPLVKGPSAPAGPGPCNQPANSVAYLSYTYVAFGNTNNTVTVKEWIDGFADASTASRWLAAEKSLVDACPNYSQNGHTYSRSPSGSGNGSVSSLIYDTQRDSGGRAALLHFTYAAVGNDVVEIRTYGAPITAAPDSTPIADAAIAKLQNATPLPPSTTPPSNAGGSGGSSNNLVGTWQGSMTFAPCGTSSTTWKFNSDGTFETNILNDQSSSRSCAGGFTVQGTYTASDSQITFHQTSQSTGEGPQQADYTMSYQLVGSNSLQGTFMGVPIELFRQ